MTRLDRNVSGAMMSTVFRAMWRNWALAFGAIVMPMMFALVMRRLWLPMVCFLEIYMLVTLMKSRYFVGAGACAAIVRMAVRALVMGALVMLAIAVLCTDWLVPAKIHLKFYNTEIPFIAALIMMPCLAISAGWMLLSGHAHTYCHTCRRKNGFYAGDSIVGTLFYRESRYQASILLLIALVLGAVEYWYYFARYNNTEFIDPDRYFFIYMPSVVYLISLGVMAGRYMTMYNLYVTVEDARPERRNTTTVRFLVFCDNDILLRLGENGAWDTPLVSVMPMRPSIGNTEAAGLFGELSDLSDFEVKYCFTTDGMAAGSNTLHFAVFVPESSRESFGDDDRWYNAYMLDCALQSGTIATPLATELYRIHTITMAWKTYDRRGRRLYPMKNYRPTFRLGDLRKWDVDYDDTSWFSVAFNNEDRKFFRLRALWQKVTGILDKPRS